MARHLGLGLQVGDHPLDFRLDLPVDIAQLPFGAEQFGVAGAVARLQIGDLAADLGALGAQLLDHLRIQRLAHIVAGAAALHLAGGGVQARHLLGFLSLGDGQLVIEVGDLLLGQGVALGAQQAVGRLIALDRRLGGDHLVAQPGQARVQPLIGPLGGLELGVELLQQIFVGIGIGDQGRLLRGVGLVADLDHIGQAGAGHLEVLEHRIDHLFMGDLRLQRRARLLFAGDRIDHAVDRAGDGQLDRAQQAGRPGVLVEKGVAVEVQGRIDLLGQIPRSQDLDLGVHGERVAGQVAHHLLFVDHGLLVLVEDDVRRAGIERLPDLHGQGYHHRQHEDRRRDDAERQLPAAKDGDIALQIQGLGRGRLQIIQQPGQALPRNQAFGQMGVHAS